MQARSLTMRLIWLSIGAALALPSLLFGIASWTTFQDIHTAAKERLVRSLDIQEEEAQKTFELVNLTMSNASDFISGMSIDVIQQSHASLHLKLSKLSAAVSAVQSIWIFDKNGRAIVTSRTDPAPTQNYLDHDFIQSQLNPEMGLFYGQVYESTSGTEPFFTISRKIMLDDEFIGVLVVSVLPSNFFKFFSTLVYTQGLQYALLREDGEFLVRYPKVPANAPSRLGNGTGFKQTIAAYPAGGFYSSTSPVDQVERQYAIRRIGTKPLYLTAGIESAALRKEWLSTMGTHLIFGIPATLLLCVTLFAVLRRTRNLYAEIDRRTLAEDSLRHSQKLESIGHLTGGVAHDFNNLLTIILGNLESLQKQLVGADAKIIRRVENAMHGANRAATLTKRLLAFSRQQPLSPTPIDVNHLMNGLSDFLRRAIGEEISLEVVGTGGVWPVEVDAAELESVLVNLAVNARDAMPSGGKLTIEASNSYLDEAYCRRHADVHPGQFVQLSVTDTGSGMPKEIVERVFEPFYTTKQAGQGTGLGLSQVYGFVKQSGGHVKIYSEVGEGTTVKIYLPRYHGEASSVSIDAVEPSRGKTGECILVVEDDRPIPKVSVPHMGQRADCAVI